MEYVIAVDPETGWGRVTISGSIGPEDFPDLLNAAWTDPLYSKVERAVWNFLEARTSLGLANLMHLTKWLAHAKQGRGATTIALVAEDDVIFGVGRMFQAVQPDTGWKIGVFRDEAAAVAWLSGSDVESDPAV